ncbi:energy transducer TonB [Rudaea cellulosilytica]|uniref:energy transducer TonB n=1 Tax=Rudaea cellulosilytica TaxID=540746 RepID=UPI000364ADD7|nr:energy transducer TonB [Rudaea cellulosilytica]
MPASSAPAAASTAAPSKPAEVAGGEASKRTDLTIADLLRNAGSALSEKRYIDPPDNSAVDFYLLVLGRDANNAAAQEGLRELLPLATGEIEQKINAGQLDESRRAIDLLGKFDSNNYTLTILRNKLDLKKKQMDREQEKRDQEKALATNAAKNAATPATTAPAAAPATPAATESKAAVADATPKPAAAPATAPAKPAAPAASSAETRAAVVTSQSAPRYPPDAFRSRQEGWVEVAFTVAADGSVKNGSVVNANPPRLFNAAALRAIADWKFQPRLENGQPAEQTMRTRIEFKLPDK